MTRPAEGSAGTSRSGGRPRVERLAEAEVFLQVRPQGAVAPEGELRARHLLQRGAPRRSGARLVGLERSRVGDEVDVSGPSAPAIPRIVPREQHANPGE